MNGRDCVWALAAVLPPVVALHVPEYWWLLRVVLVAFGACVAYRFGRLVESEARSAS